ncbi:MAG: carboxypeptidase regulatory-like domain-containing protein [Thermoplasmata archaeon]
MSQYSGKLVTLLLAGALVLTAVAAAPMHRGGRQTGEARLYGIVRDGHTHLPLEDVKVALSNASYSPAPVFTAADGSYELTVPDPDGTYTVHFSLKGYTARDETVTLIPEREFQLDVNLTPETSHVKGVVRSHGDAVPGADVLLISEEQLSTRTNATGHFQFALLGYGRTFTLRVTADGMYGYKESFRLALGEEKLMDLELAPVPGATSVVWGYVLNREGEPVEGARVTFTERSTGKWIGTVSGKGGYYTLTLSAGFYDIKVEAVGFLSFSGAMDVVEAKRERKDVTISAAPAAGTRVGGTVKDKKTSAPVAGAEVTLIDADGTRNSVTTDASGSYSILTYPGNFTLEASALNYFLYRQKLEVGQSDVTVGIELSPIPERVYSVWGYVLDAAGLPVQSARVILFDLDPEHTGYLMEDTTPVGGYYRIPVYPGSFLLIGQAAGYCSSVSELRVTGSKRVDITLSALSPPDLTEELEFRDWSNLTITASLLMTASEGTTRWDIDRNFGDGDGTVSDEEAGAYLETLRARGPPHRDTREYLTVDGVRYTYVEGWGTGSAPDAAGNATNTSRITVVHRYNLTANATVPEAVHRILKINATYDSDTMSSRTIIKLPVGYEMRRIIEAGPAVEVRGTYEVVVDPMAQLPGAALPYEWVALNISKNEPPVADTDGNKTVRPGAVVYFDASTSSDDFGIENFTWEFGDGEKGYGASVNHTYNTTNDTKLVIYNVTLTVTDTGGLTNTTYLTVTIDGEAPTARIQCLPENATVVEDSEPLELNASASIDNVEIVRYHWDFGDYRSGEGVLINHTYTQPGTYNITLNVTDKAGNFNVTILRVTVLDNTTPTARFIMNVTTSPARLPVEFNASTADDNVAIIWYVWDFGDNSSKVEGNESVAMVVNHTYEKEGIYTVTLNVSDGKFWNETTQTITITPPLIFAELHPVAKPEFSNSNPAEGDTVRISVKVTNTGERAAENFTVRFQAGTKKIGDKKVRLLSVGETKTVEVEWKPRKGTHNVTVFIDVGSAIPELNETNNTAWVKISVRESLINWYLLAGAVVLVVVIVGGYFYMRRREEAKYREEEEEEEEEEELEEDEKEEAECPKCFAEVKPTDRKCPSCGANLRR